MWDIDFDVIWRAYGALLTFLDVIAGSPSSAARSIAFSKDFGIFRKIFRNQKDLSKNHKIQINILVIIDLSVILSSYKANSLIFLSHFS